MLRLPCDSFVANNRREPNGNSVEFPAVHSFLKVFNKLLRPESRAGTKLTLTAGRQQQFYVCPANVDNENLPVHGRPFPERLRGQNYRSRRPRRLNKLCFCGFAAVLPGQHSTISSATNLNSSCRADFRSSLRFLAICCTGRVPLNCEANKASSEVSFNLCTRSKPSLV